MTSLVVLLLLLGIGCSPKGEPAPPEDATSTEDGGEPSTTKDAPSRVFPDPDFVVTAAEITEAFAANPDETLEKYEGKWLQMTGPLRYESMRGVSSRRFGSDEAVFEADFGYEAKEWQYVKPRLITTQEVTVIGKCTEISEGVVVLTECMAVEFGPDPTEDVTAAEVTSAYATDVDQALARFEYKPFVVQGKIQRMINSDREKKIWQSKIHLAGHEEGDGALTVVIGESGGAHYEIFDKYEVGDTIRVRGELNRSNDGKHIWLSYSELVLD